MNTAVISRLAVGLTTIVFLGACNKGGDGAKPGTDSDNGDGIVAAGAESSTTTTVEGGLGDPNIIYMLDAANMDDSVKGALALTKGTSADVREFAMMMVRDHHTMRQKGEDLAKRLAIQPAPPVGDSLPAKLESAVSKLTAAAKGRDFDKAYVDHEVTAHREVLTTLVAAMSATQNSEIKNLIQQTAPVVQVHLDKAKAIQMNIQK